MPLKPSEFESFLSEPNPVRGHVLYRTPAGNESRRTNEPTRFEAKTHFGYGRNEGEPECRLPDFWVRTQPPCISDGQKANQSDAWRTLNLTVGLAVKVESLRSGLRSNLVSELFCAQNRKQKANKYTPQIYKKKDKVS